MHPELTLLIAHARRRDVLRRAERARLPSLAPANTSRPTPVREVPASSRQPPRLRLVPAPAPVLAGPGRPSPLGALGPQTPAA